MVVNVQQVYEQQHQQQQQKKNIWIFDQTDKIYMFPQFKVQWLGLEKRGTRETVTGTDFLSVTEFKGFHKFIK